MEKRKIEGKKGDLELDIVVIVVISIVVMVLAVGAYFIFSGKGQSIIGYIENLLRFGP